ncbi:MAG: hypothetical protein ACI8UO_004814 [Verrucomicrobiales bacterium]|jgi:hypothetical protein
MPLKEDSWLLNPSILHPMGGCTWKRFWQEYRANRPYNWKSLPSRLLSMLSVPFRAPAIMLEKRRHGDAIRKHELGAPPVFIIGHWRSGTTHLHNLLSLDPQFAFLSFLQTAMPHDFLSANWFTRGLMKATMPKTRGMDNMAIAIDLPQEEEIALGILSGISCFKCFYFPQNLRQHLVQSILLEDITAEQLLEFKDAYVHLVKKVSYAAEGTRPVLFKNPASTSRIRLLLELFPDARFVHIVRNPHDVYHSMEKMWRRMESGFSWQNSQDVDFTEAIFEAYEMLMTRYLRDRESVPAGQLVEIHYEDLDRSPVETIDSIYEGLALAGRDDARVRVAEETAKLAGYQKNQHPDDPAIREKVAERWAFAFEAFGYSP